MCTNRAWAAQHTPPRPLTSASDVGACLPQSCEKKVTPLGLYPRIFPWGLVRPSVPKVPETSLRASGIYICFHSDCQGRACRVSVCSAWPQRLGWSLDLLPKEQPGRRSGAVKAESSALGDGLACPTLEQNLVQEKELEGRQVFS